MCNECTQFAFSHIVITGNITSIDHCFIGLRSVKSISLPDTVKEIKGGSFNGCYNLKSVYLPESLKVIDNAFNECSGLLWANIPENIEVLCGFGYAKFTNLEIPRTVKKLALCSDTLERIYIPETVTADMLKATGHVNEFMEEEFGESTFSGIHTKSKKLVVMGYNKSAAQSWTKEKGCKFEAISSVPEKLSVANAINFIKISWSQVDKTESWTLYRKATDEKNWTKLGTFSASKTTYYDKTVKSGKIYTYRLMGDNNKIYRDAKISRLSAPKKIIIYSKSATTATLKWSKVDGAKYYYIYKRSSYTQNGKYIYTKIARVDAKYNYYRIKDIDIRSAEYGYCVRAYDGTSLSPYSDIAEFEPGKLLITSCTVNMKNNTITVKWPSSKGAVRNDFHIFYKEKDNKDVREVVTVKASKFKTSGNYHYVTFTPKNTIKNFNGLSLEALTYYDCYTTSKPSEAGRLRATSNRVSVVF